MAVLSKPVNKMIVIKKKRPSNLYMSLIKPSNKRIYGFL